MKTAVCIYRNGRLETQYNNPHVPPPGRFIYECCQRSLGFKDLPDEEIMKRVDEGCYEFETCEGKWKIMISEPKI